MFLIAIVGIASFAYLFFVLFRTFRNLQNASLTVENGFLIKKTRKEIQKLSIKEIREIRIVSMNYEKGAPIYEDYRGPLRSGGVSPAFEIESNNDKMYVPWTLFVFPSFPFYRLWMEPIKEILRLNPKIKCDSSVSTYLNWKPSLFKLTFPLLPFNHPSLKKPVADYIIGFSLAIIALIILFGTLIYFKSKTF